ncbi:porin family protein [Dyella sp.]|uniref:outer membrane protein n=1 Tax=Dyella sp. TaxID=1869338 RepID=UPI002ED43EDA
MNKKLLAVAFAAAGLSAAPAVFAQQANSNTGYAPTYTGPDQDHFQPGQPVGSGNWFIDANVGRTGGGNGGFGQNLDSFNFTKGERGRRTGYGLTGGYRWKVGQDFGLGLEAGYVDLGNFRVKNVFNSQPVNQSSTTNALRGWLVGVNGRMNLVDGWYLSARGGYFHANNYDHRYTADESAALGVTTGGRAGRGSWYAGLGTGWDINQHWGVGVSYDYFHANAGKLIDTATGATESDLKRSTGIVSLSGEYRF